MTRTLRIRDFWAIYKGFKALGDFGELRKVVYPNLAKVGVVGSNPIARSKILDLIEGSTVTT